MNYNSLMNKPTINYRELIGDNSVTEVGGITEEQFNTLLNTDLSSYYTKAQIDELFARSFVYREKSGSIVTFDCPASVNGINKVVSEIVAVQAGNGDPSPTNVRPISGWDEVNVVVSPTTDAEDGTTYTTALKDGQGNPMTCYGGQLVNENGVQRLENETGYYKITNNTSISKSGDYFEINNVLPEDATDNYEFIASFCKRTTTSLAYMAEGEARFVTGRRYLAVKLPYSTETEALNALTSIVAEITWKNPTPQQIPQDSMSIATQEGTNNLWADSGDITVKALDKIIQE